MADCQLGCSSCQGILARYRGRIKIAADAQPISLGEGCTPLIPAPRLAEALGGGFDLYLKYEGMNPTGSFKDRGMTAAITQAAYEGATSVICASTGNTAASAAAYAARAGMTCFVLVPDGKIAQGKLAGSLSYGAMVLAIRGTFDDGLRLVREAAERSPVALVNSVNPYRLEGQKTSAFEIVETLGAPPDWLCLPVGNAGNISAYWMGFSELLAEGQTHTRPRLLGTQAAGAAPLVLGHPVDKPETVATAIRIGNPARWQQAVDALREANGYILAASDDEILEAYRMVARLEGVFCEPSSAAGIAGLRQSIQTGRVDVRGQRVVCVLTGHGLKDPDQAMANSASPLIVDATYEAMARAIGL